MKILAIETSCDETALCLLSGNSKAVTIISNEIASQATLHSEYGGVFPNLAKREHVRQILPLLTHILKPVIKNGTTTISSEQRKAVQHILDREPALAKQLLTYCSSIEKPDIDYIAVTYGPGLEPALWVGITVAQALSTLWNIPVLPINHMEGHLVSTLITGTEGIQPLHQPEFPLLALLVSGGHTELILARRWNTYEKIGATRDDAAGEAFDKVARMLDLPYPGGPAIAAQAAVGEHAFDLPRPMINTDDYDFSFSGLKTAVKYLIRDLGDLSETVRNNLAFDFQEAVTDVLVAKTKRAVAAYHPKTIVVGGGVSANTRLQEKLQAAIQLPVRIPPRVIATDNALMIALAAYVHIQEGSTTPTTPIQADGQASL